MEDDAFLRAIEAAPDDDAYRLVYADWLDEQDDPRGTFVRLDCEFARLPTSDERVPLLVRQLQGLADRVDRDWLARVSRWPRCPKCRTTVPYSIVERESESYDADGDLSDAFLYIYRDIRCPNPDCLLVDKELVSRHRTYSKH